jgi:selenocysteine-specific elongation factor
LKTNSFDALIEQSWLGKKDSRAAFIKFDKKKIQATLFRYKVGLKESLSGILVRVQTMTPLDLTWGDTFELFFPKETGRRGRGKVVHPESRESGRMASKNRAAFLNRFLGSGKDMILALLEERGIQGLSGRELMAFSGLRKDVLVSLSLALEAEGQVKILAFSPLLLFSRKSLEFLQKEILEYIKRFHDKHPNETGPSAKEIQHAFHLNPMLWKIALKYLMQKNRVRFFGEHIALCGFKIRLSSQEKEIFANIRRIYGEGKFHALSMKDLQERFSLSEKRLNTLISILVEEKKVVFGKEGFLIHSPWLEDVIGKLRARSAKELTISDFKQLTGLTRKFAIPLLELLDQMGVTRRKGDIRRIL